MDGSSDDLSKSEDEMPNTEDMVVSLDCANSELATLNSMDIRNLLGSQPPDFLDQRIETTVGDDDQISLLDYKDVLLGPEEAPIAKCEPSLSMESFEGPLDFKVFFNVPSPPSSKWVFSQSANKLYMKPNTPVPLEIYVNQWISGAYLNITPVFSDPHFHMPVIRCPAHELEDKQKGSKEASHIIRFDDQNVIYSEAQGRRFCEVPLMPPAPGQSTVQLYMRTGCWSTCPKGPDRKPFCVLLTLIVGGEEVGRQIIDLKSCECPLRDKRSDEKKTQKRKCVAQKKGASTGNPCKKVKFEPETSSSDTHVNLSVPVEILPDVKRYINAIMGERHARLNGGFEPPYSDV